MRSVQYGCLTHQRGRGLRLLALHSDQTRTGGHAHLYFLWHYCVWNECQRKRENAHFLKALNLTTLMIPLYEMMSVQYDCFTHQRGRGFCLLALHPDQMRTGGHAAHLYFLRRILRWPYWKVGNISMWFFKQSWNSPLTRSNTCLSFHMKGIVMMGTHWKVRIRIFLAWDSNSFLTDWNSSHWHAWIYF